MVYTRVLCWFGLGLDGFACDIQHARIVRVWQGGGQTTWRVKETDTINTRHQLLLHARTGGVQLDVALVVVLGNVEERNLASLREPVHVRAALGVSHHGARHVRAVPDGAPVLLGVLLFLFVFCVFLGCCFFWWRRDVYEGNDGSVSWWCALALFVAHTPKKEHRHTRPLIN